MRYATKLVATIKQRIEAGTFDYAEFFPDSPRVKQAQRQDSFGEMCDTWLQTKGRLAAKTLDQYRNALEVWQRLLGEQTPIRSITHGKVAACIGGTAWASPKLLNNYLIVLRGVFKLAVRELGLRDNPMDGVENSRHQAPGPDPLSVEEMVSVLAEMRDRYDVRIWAYFAFAFATGMRPEEQIALRWTDVDWRSQEVLVERARTKGEVRSLKTYNARTVELTELAQEALRAMKPWTLLAASGEAFIFQNPVTRREWHDERSQREHYWTPTLKRLGIRARRAYTTRHTYATIALMAGANPVYISRQMGHANAKMLFTVYARWIDKADRGRERGKLDGAMSSALGQTNVAATGG
jgi:integrase